MYNLIKLNFNKEIKSYFLGFLFSLLLTIVPFLLVMKQIFSSEINYIIIVLCALIQIIIHFIYFLNLNIVSKERWNVITLLFVIMIIFIIVMGSIWIMHNLNHHMIN